MYEATIFFQQVAPPFHHSAPPPLPRHHHLYLAHLRVGALFNARNSWSGRSRTSPCSYFYVGTRRVAPCFLHGARRPAEPSRAFSLAPRHHACKVRITCSPPRRLRPARVCASSRPRFVALARRLRLVVEPRLGWNASSPSIPQPPPMCSPRSVVRTNNARVHTTVFRFSLNTPQANVRPRACTFVLYWKKEGGA